MLLLFSARSLRNALVFYRKLVTARLLGYSDHSNSWKMEKHRRGQRETENIDGADQRKLKRRRTAIRDGIGRRKSREDIKDSKWFQCVVDANVVS